MHKKRTTLANFSRESRIEVVENRQVEDFLILTKADADAILCTNITHSTQTNKIKECVHNEKNKSKHHDFYSILVDDNYC